MPLSYETLLLRIVVGGALGAVIGFERDRHQRPAGLRTHLLVALASATFMVISSQFAFYQQFPKDSVVEVDAARIAAQVVSGAGFLAGGAILRTGLNVQGLTTAAGMWLVTAIGLAAGAGMFVVAGAATSLGVVTLWGLRTLDEKGQLREYSDVALVIDGEPSVDELTRTIETTGAVVMKHDYQRFYGEAPRVDATFAVRHREGFEADTILRAFEDWRGLRSVRVNKRP